MKLLYNSLWILFMLFLFAGCSQGPVFPGKDWQIKTPEEAGFDAARLESAIQYLNENSGKDKTKELVIVKDGYVIYQGENADKVHNVWSMSKSFVSTVLELLIDDGKCTLDSYAKDFVTEMSGNYPDVTLCHFATMTSGYRAVGDEPKGSYRHGPSSMPFVPSDNPLFAPGTHFSYWDSAMNQFANVLTHIAQIPLDSLFFERIANPIGMERNSWQWGDFGEIDGIKTNGGAGNHGKGIYISALAAARFGYLFLNQGTWQNKQVLSKEWVRKATRVQVDADLPMAGFSSNGPGHYGFNWWVNGRDSAGNRQWPDAPANTYSASGFNNNDLFVIPEWGMVIVRLGLDQNEYLITDDMYNEFLKNIGQSLQ